MDFEKLPPEIVLGIAAHLLFREVLYSFAQVNSRSYRILRRAVINSQNFAGLILLAQASKSGNQEAVASWLQAWPGQGFDTFLQTCIEAVGAKRDSAEGHFRHSGITIEEFEEDE